jgi:hypothetical protein
MKKTILSAIAGFFASIGEKLFEHLNVHMGRTGMIAHVVPSSSEINSFRVTNPGQSEVIRQRLYDYNLYPTAGAQQINFFSQPIGQGLTSAVGAVAGQPKTKLDTNIVLANTLPSGQQYLIESIEVLFMPGSVATANTYTPAALASFLAATAATVAGPVNDVNTVYQSGVLELNILSKTYLQETPLLAFPPKAHFELDAASSSTSATMGVLVHQLAKAAGRPYFLEPPISLQPATNFGVSVTWPAAVATGSGFNGRIGVILDGYFERASQ